MYTLNEIKPRILLELEKIDESHDRNSVIENLKGYGQHSRHYFTVDLYSAHKMTDLEKIESFIETIIDEAIRTFQDIIGIDETIRQSRIKNLEYIQKVLFDTIDLIKKEV